MGDVVYFAEIEIYQPDHVNIEQLERLEDSLFESQENLADEEKVIDEDKVVVDEEEGFLIVVTADFDDLSVLKTELKKILSKHVDSNHFEFTAHIYKDEYLEEIDDLSKF